MTTDTPAQSSDLRHGYAQFVFIATRATDLDESGQFTAAACCSLFETTIREFFLREGGPNVLTGRPTAPHVQEVLCRFHRFITFPQDLAAGLRVTNLGHSSVRYEIALFREDEAKPAVTGHVVHVFVDSEKGKPSSIPPPTHCILRKLLPSSRGETPGDPTRRCG